MDKTTLVEKDINDGKKLIENIKVETNLEDAFWLFFKESNSWKLILSTKDVDIKGPKILYEKISKYLFSKELGFNSSIDLFSNIKLASPNSNLIQLLRKNTADVGIKLVESRLINTTINNLFVEDIYVYFITKNE